MAKEQQEDTLNVLEKSASAAHSIQNAVKTGKAVSSVAKGAAAGPYGAAAGFLWENRENIRKIISVGIALFLLPVVFLIMLPSVIFDDMTLDREIPIMNDNTTLTQNIRDAELAVWTILKESHDNVIAQIDGEIAALGENETGIVSDDYASGNPINSATVLSQYSASKNYAEINIDDLIKTVSAYQEQLFSYTVSSESSINEDGETITTYYYTVVYSGDSFFADNIFKLEDSAKETAGYYAENLLIFLYGALYDSGVGGMAQVSPEVMQYADFIRKYAQLYGIPEYFDLICAVMMAESGGRVPDVMQSSECPYNTKYPKSPGAIDDPEYSIDCGVHYLADCLKSAGSTSPADTGKVSLALQGYNYGNGYISWAVGKYGGYSEANAIEFSNMMKQKLGWKNYGNPRYVQAVLKYLIPVGKGGFGSPFVGRNWLTAVTSEFGNRVDPINGKPGAFHDGLDIAYPIGTPINAVRGGTVLVASDTGNGFGLHIVIDNGSGITTLYGHCSKLLVSAGQQVQTGQVIAEVGKTGRVTGPHLHLTFTVNGQKKNPRDYLDVPN